MPLLAEMVDQRAQEKIPRFKKEKKKLSDCASGTYAYKLPRQGTKIEIYVSSDCQGDSSHVTLWWLKFDGELVREGQGTYLEENR